MIALISQAHLVLEETGVQIVGKTVSKNFVLFYQNVAPGLDFLINQLAIYSIEAVI